MNSHISALIALLSAMSASVNCFTNISFLIKATERLSAMFQFPDSLETSFVQLIDDF